MLKQCSSGFDEKDRSKQLCFRNMCAGHSTGKSILGACLGPRNSITLIDGASAAMTHDRPARRESMRTKLGDDFAVAPLLQWVPQHT